MRKWFIWFLLPLPVILLFLAAIPVFSVTSSSLGQFNVTPSFVFLNWTNSYSSNITIAINSSFGNITIELLNTTSASGNYSQSNSLTECQAGYKLFVKNATTGSFTSSTSPALNGTNTTDMTLVDSSHLQCSAGRYWIEKFTARNTTWTNETANITVFIDIPISSTNNPSLQAYGNATFSGSLPANATNTTSYHSYYFNTSEIANATSLTINLTGWSSSQDADLFLFDDSGSLKEKSINKNTTESLTYSFLPSTPAMWEIRIYGNSTSTIPYTGYLMFTTLNTTNSSNQQISSIDFGIVNASTSKQVNLTLRNEGNFSLSNVQESKELYYVKRFSDSGNKNFTFLVPEPSIATKVKVALNWTGASNYSFNLYNSNGTLLANSVNKYVYANKTNAMQEEQNETSDIVDATYWTVEVKNNSAITDTYTVNTFVYLNASSWLVSNFSSSGFTFNTTSQNNSVYGVQINLNVSNATLDGSYEGNLKYKDSRGGEIKIPITINVTSPMLVVTNDYPAPATFSVLNSGTYRIDENYGSNLTRTFNFKLNNTGIYDMIVNLTNSPNLTCTSSSCSGDIANFTYSLPDIKISKNNYQTLSLSVSFNSSNRVGTYEGSITINATNETVALSSHPYQTFTLNIKLNLTNRLYLNVSEIIAARGANILQNISTGENVTIKLNVFYINQTTEIITLNTSNFTTAWLQEKNVSGSTGRIPTTGSLSIFNGTNPIYTTSSPKYAINLSIPPNQPGGQYEVHVIATHNRSDSRNFEGEGANITTLIINNTGLYMSTSSSLSSVTVGSDVYYNVSVKNFGPLASSTENVTFSDVGCNSTTITAYDSGPFTCGTPNGNAFTTLGMSGYNNTGCWFRWKVHGDANGTCSGMYVKGGGYGWFNNITGLSITVSSSTTTTTAAAPSLPAPGETAAVAPKHLDITSYPTMVLVTQGSTNSSIVTVKNINTTRGQDVKVIVESINSSWFSTTPALLTGMLPLNSTNFTVTFNVPTNAEVKDYSAKFTAVSNYANTSKTFTLRVLPRPETKAEINATLASLKLNMTGLWKEINQSAQKGVNVTFANTTLLQVKAKIEQAENYIKQGDYFSAKQLFETIKSLTDTARTQLNQAIQENEANKWLKLPGISLPPGTLKYILIAGGIVAAIILAYLFWPVKTEKPTVEKLYIPKEEEKEKEDIVTRLKEKWENLSKQKQKEKK